MDPDWKSLEPILRSTFTSDAAATGCLRGLGDWIVTASQQILARMGLSETEGGDPGELYVRLAEKVLAEKGLERASNEGDGSGWLYVVLKNLARTRARATWGRQAREVGSDTVADAPVPEGPPVVEAAEVVEALVDAQARGLNPLELFALVALTAPIHVRRDHVDAACAFEPRRAATRGRSGFFREADETWAHYSPWALAYPYEDLHRDPALLHLAWIVRSEDPSDPARWKQAWPFEAGQGRNTVQRWFSDATRKLGGRRG